MAPLSDSDVSAFVAACGASLPLVPAKRWKGEPIGSGNIGSLSQASAAIRVHSASEICAEVGPVLPGRIPDSHLLSQVSAQRHFDSELMSTIIPEQQSLDRYLKNGCLCAPPGLTGLIHHLDARILCEVDALLLYTLPLDTGELSSDVISQLCENATGRSLPKMQDPTDFGDIELEEKRAENTALERLLAEIYPTITKVQITWKERLKLGAKLIDFLDDINVLFSVPTPGVPRVYADTLAEMEQRLKMLRHKDPAPVHMYASKIFYRPPQASMTTLGNLLATICSGLWVSCHLKPTQRSSFTVLLTGLRPGDGNRPTGAGCILRRGQRRLGRVWRCSSSSAVCRIACRILATVGRNGRLRQRTVGTPT